MDKVNYRVIKSDPEDIFSKVIIADKPIGVTSHDVVDYFRHELNTRKVGHAGTLDPFAEGELIIASGKFTQSLNAYLELPKTYTFKAVIGIESLSGDNQEIVTKLDKEYFNKDFKESELERIKTNLEKTLEKFKIKYIQNVPVFSSVKVEGYKLRELGREYPSFKIVNTLDISKEKLQSLSKNLLKQQDDSLKEGEKRKIVIFERNSKSIVILIPQRTCKIYNYKDINIQVENISLVSKYSSYTFDESLKDNLKGKKIEKVTKILTISASLVVESGTYVRTLIEDLTNDSINSLGCLYYLRREYDLTKILV